MASDTKFKVGDRVFSDLDQQRGQVVSVLYRVGGEGFYKVRLTSGKFVRQSGRDLTLVRGPLERLGEGRLGYAADFDLLTQATKLFFAYRYEGLSCLSNSRLEPKPYQVFVAHRVLQDLYPRYLLADEVGLGKTIEAGMIVKELRARGLAERVLIIVPASLREQWKGELAVKFNERFHIYEGATIKENLRRYPDRNPWTLDDSVIASLSFARMRTARKVGGGDDDKARKRAIEEGDWDLVIFDEAHHVRRHPEKKGIGGGRTITESYRLGAALSERTESLLLLTAVPLQLHPYETFSLVELLDPSLFPSCDDFDLSTATTEALVRLDHLLHTDGQEIQEDSEIVLDAYHRVLLEHLVLQAEESGGESKSPLAELRRIASSESRGASGATRELTKAFDEVAPHLDEDSFYRVIETARAEFYSFVMRYPEIFHRWVQAQHKLAQVMIRNRKREVLKGEMVDRRAHMVRVILTAEERNLHREVNEYIRHAYARLSGSQALGLVLTTFRKLLVSSPHALAGSLERRAARIEQVLNGVESGSGRLDDYQLEELSETLESTEELEGLLGLTGGLSAEEAQEEVKTLKDLSARARAVADPYDSKAHELLLAVKPLLEGDSTEKVLIFTQFLETQSYLQSLFEERGYKVALFHGEGGRSGYSKQAEFRRFKQDPTVRVMISTEVGGEGLNFQFCHVMFNYDLPWNPMRIEQRIGRLDRIGQKRDVQIYNFLLDGTLDGRILSVLQDRIQLFERTIGNLDPILGEDIEDEIERIVLSDEAEAEQELADWEERIEERVRDAREAEDKMADFIMDARSFRRDTVDELLGREPPLSNEDIESFALDLLGRYPTGTVESPGDDLYTITVPGRFKEDCRRLYGIHLHDRYKGTFDPATAIENETVDFFAFGHPLFDAMIQFCMDDEMKNRLDARTAQRVLHHNDYAGCKGIQFNYVLRFDGVRTHKKLVPVFLRLNGEYDDRLSQLVLSLPSQNTDGRRGRIQVSSTKVERLEERSEEVMSEILRRELREARQRNKEDYAHERERVQRLFDYRVARQEIELERRQAQLEDVREKGQQERVVRMWEGQVKATKGRIEDLQEQREQALAELDEGRRTKPGYELLNTAYVEIRRATLDSR